MEIYSYQTIITKSTQKLALFINCNNCNLTTEFSGEVTNILIKDQIVVNFNNTNEQGKEIYYYISNNMNCSQNYNFRIISFDNNSLLIPMNSIRNEYCKIENECKFFIIKEEYNKIEKIRLLTPNSNELKIKIFEEIKENTFYQKEEINISNDNNTIENYKEFDIAKDDLEQIFIIEINYTSSYNYDFITLVSSHYDTDFDSMNYIYPEDYVIINLEENKNLSISPLLYDGFLHYDLNLIKGVGCSVLKNETYKLELGFKENLNLLMNSREDSKDDSNIKFEAKTNFTFYFRIILNPYENNLVELNFQKSNYYSYLNYKNYPLYFFMKLKNSPLSDIHLNYKFCQKYRTSYFNSTNESIDTIKMYLVDDFFIKNKNNINFENLNSSYACDEIPNNNSFYRNDFTAGYSLIDSNYLNNDGGKYLLIIINYDNLKDEDISDDVNIAITAFDFTNNIFPMNEYLLMLIKGNQSKTIYKRNLNFYDYNSFIEYDLKNINFLYPTENYDNQYGFLDLGDIEKISLESNIESELPNSFIKYGLSKYDNFSYFSLSNKNITFNNDSETISFTLVEEKNNTNEYEYSELYAIYNIKIFNVTDCSEERAKTIYETTPPYQLIKSINDNEKNEISIKFIPIGFYYINVLAEVRKGNIYEYLSYKPLYIEKIAENLTKLINITKKTQFFEPKYTKNQFYRVNNIEYDDNNKTGYIKLTVFHKYYSDKNHIYVSYSENIFNSSSPYKDSQFKVIDRNTSLIIPLSEMKNESLYIRIPCNYLCDYIFSYTYYKNNITVENNECFDISLNDNNVSFKFNPELKNAMRTSLFTMTSYSLDKFQVSFKSEKNLQKTFYNGYSQLVEHNNKDLSLKDILFSVEGNLTVKICHRFIMNNKEEKKFSNIIFSGDIKYSIFNKYIPECFSIENDLDNIDNISEYRMNLLTKGKNVNISFYSLNQLYHESVNEESSTIIFNNSYNKICFSSSHDSDALFQILPVLNNITINQSLNMPLIRGIPTKQNLKPNQMLYYKINEYKDNSNIINVNFQILSGSPKLYYTNCTNFPNCQFSNLIEIKEGFNNNNLNYKIQIDENERDIYHKSKFPVMLVKCEDIGEDCNFYIEMSNENEEILLNKNRKIYSNNINTNCIDKYLIELPKNYKNGESQIYIQLYYYTGQPNISVSIDNENIMFGTNFNNNTIFVNSAYSNKFEINVTNEKDEELLYNIFYYIIEDDIYLPSGEVHYCIINQSYKPQIYYFQDALQNSKNYIVSVNPINYNLSYNKGGENWNESNIITLRGIQLNINSLQNLSISCNRSGIICQFTISVVEVNNKSSNELIFNDRTYNFFNFSQDFNNIKIKYIISRKNIDNNIYLNINKKSNDILYLGYGGNNITLKDYNEIKKINVNLSQVHPINFNSNELFYINFDIYSENNNISFKIKINGNRDYFTYLDPEEIEKGIIESGRKITYYYEYYKNNSEQIYFDCKGSAKLQKTIKLFEQNTFGRNIYENYENELEANNYINLNNNDCSSSCLIYFSIELEEGKKDNIYNIYIISNKRRLKVFNNLNIYGNLKGKEAHIFETPFSKPFLLLNLNCFNCILKITKEDQKDIYYYNKSEYLNLKEFVAQKSFNYSIETYNLNQTNSYYYFSIIDQELPKFVYQSESTICKLKCKYILPLHKFYSYNNLSILLYVPETENVVISQKIINENEDLYALYQQNENITYNSTSENYNITNRLFIDFSNEDDENKYMLIEVNNISGVCNHLFNLIISKFHDFDFYDNSILFPQNIFRLSNIRTIPIDNDINIKNIRMHLINGSGFFKFNENNNGNNNEVYNLNYENQEILTIINKAGNLNAFSLSKEEEFIFYLNVESNKDKNEKKYKNNNENNYDLILQKTNYIKYYDHPEKKFKIKLKIDIIKGFDLYVNYYFSKLEPYVNQKDDLGLINCENEVFSVNVLDKGISINNQSYYNDTRRGYFYILNANINSDYFILEISQSNFNLNNYKNVYLQVTPLYFGANIQNFELPRNTYLDFKFLKQSNPLNFIISKPNEKYNFSKIELSYNDHKSFNLTMNSNDLYLQRDNSSFGKSIYYINDGIKKYNVSLHIDSVSKKDHILIRHSIQKNNRSKFNLTFNNITLNPNDQKKNNSFSLVYYNIKCVDNYTDYKINYIIRIYDFLDHYYDEEINNINTDVRLLCIFRKELNESEIKNDIISQNMEINTKLNDVSTVSIIGEVLYNDTVEYFSYNYTTFSYKRDKIIEFDEVWIAPLIIVLVILVAIFIYLILHSIKNQKKQINGNGNEDQGKFVNNSIGENQNI